MQVLEGQDDLGCVEAAVGLGEAADPSQVGEHLAAGDEFQDHIEVRVVLNIPLCYFVPSSFPSAPDARIDRAE